MQQINIYYGGRGLIEDPTIYVMNKLTEVLGELNMEVKKYNLYEDKQGHLRPAKDPEGGGRRDPCRFRGVAWDRRIFTAVSGCLLALWRQGSYQGALYASGCHRHYCRRKDAYQTLTRAWEILGGIPCEGICTYVADHTDFETNPDYALLIEKKAESFYRSFSKKLKVFPSSTNSICENTLRPKTMQLTPQESEQLSMYVSDNNYVQKQKEDIEELTSMFKGLLGDTDEEKRLHR